MSTHMKDALSLHKTYEKKTPESDRVAVLYVSDGESVKKIDTEGKIDKWAESLSSSTTLRVTSVHACDQLLLDLREKGIKILYANWHDTGLEKGLLPEEIAQKFALLPEGVFREFHPRKDLADLRYYVSHRLAVVDFKKAAELKLMGVARAVGRFATNAEGKKTYLPSTVDALKEVNKAENFKITLENGKKVNIDSYIEELASRIPECVIFKEAADFKDGWGTAATVVAFLGGVERFGSLYSLQHYCGEHVVNGIAPKKKKGSPVDWSPKVRTALWQMSNSIIKNRENRWRDFYDHELAKEVAVHPVKCPDCKHPQSHCISRAKRKMRKAILKEFYFACVGKGGGRNCCETHPPVASVTV